MLQITYQVIGHFHGVQLFTNFVWNNEGLTVSFKRFCTRSARIVKKRFLHLMFCFKHQPAICSLQSVRVCWSIFRRFYHNFDWEMRLSAHPMWEKFSMFIARGMRFQCSMLEMSADIAICLFVGCWALQGTHHAELKVAADFLTGTWIEFKDPNLPTKYCSGFWFDWLFMVFYTQSVTTKFYFPKATRNGWNWM